MSAASPAASIAASAITAKETVGPIMVRRIDRLTATGSSAATTSNRPSKPNRRPVAECRLVGTKINLAANATFERTT